MHRRDIQIAEKLVETKLRTGYPDKFRTCWGKNISEQIFKIANLLHAHGLEKGITLARQTNSKAALENVKRDNIKLEAYSDLEKKFNSELSTKIIYSPLDFAMALFLDLPVLNPLSSCQE